MSAGPTTMLLPAKLVKEAQPFSIDFGGSVIKIAYKLENEAPNEDGMLRVYLTSFPRANLTEALDFIRETVKLSKIEDQQTLSMTGVGISEYTSTIEEALGVKVKAMWEGICFTRMFRYVMSTQGDEQLFFPALSVRDEAVERLVEDMKRMSMSVWQPHWMEMKPWDYEGYRTWPLLLVGLGSGFTFNAMDKNGAEMPCTYQNTGGRAFYGLGCLLTGAKSFEELIALAEAGDDHSVNTYLKDMGIGKGKRKPEGTGTETGTGTGEEETEDPYTKMTLDAVAFSYGWAVNKELGDFKREDMARALLNNVCDNVVQFTMLVAGQMQISNVIVMGGFAMNPFIRKMLERHFVNAKAMGDVFPFNSVCANMTFRTLRAGSHLSCVGAMFADVALKTDLVTTKEASDEKGASLVAGRSP